MHGQQVGIGGEGSVRVVGHVAVGLHVGTEAGIGVPGIEGRITTKAVVCR